MKYGLSLRPARRFQRCLFSLCLVCLCLLPFSALVASRPAAAAAPEPPALPATKAISAAGAAGIEKGTAGSHVTSEPGEPSELSVPELAQQFTARYGKRVPHEWRERGPGIVSVLPQSAYCGIDQSNLPGAEKSANQTPQGVVPNQTPARGVALTLDACEGRTDMRIIALLREHKIPATIFVTTIWLRRNAPIAADLAADPLFTLQAHGTRHKPASVAGWSAFGIPGTGNIAALVDEVEANARAITAVTGKRPRWFRSGTAFYDEVALLIIRDLGFSVAGFAISADQGATLPFRSVAKRLLSAKDGDIVLMHVNHPESGTYEGMKEALPKMVLAGVQFVGL